VTYDNRSLLINGQRTLFHSFGVHYTRATALQWDDILGKAASDGYNMVQTYFFTNAHQPKSTVWPWVQEGPSDLRLFLTKVAAAGLFVNFRIGPYVCAEWSFGGYPYDVAVPNMTSRSSNPQWEKWMSSVLLNATREFRNFFADRGGPIILAQVENELHTNDEAYIDFCGALTAESGVPIPWEMCNGASARNTINSCNSGDCTDFIENNGQNGRVLIDQPALWTENWMGCAYAPAATQRGAQ
jgi:beta-galactosidase GanA